MHVKKIMRIGQLYTGDNKVMHLSVLFSFVSVFEEKNAIPDNTGWMQLRNKERAKIMARPETASTTSGLLVKGTPYTSLRARIST